MRKRLELALKSEAKQAARQAVSIYERLTKNHDPEDARIDAVLRALQFYSFRELQGFIADTIDDVLIDGIRVGSIELGWQPTGDAFTALNTWARDYADEYAAQFVGKKLVDGVLLDNGRWSISAGTREMLRQTVTRAFEQGLSPAELAADIEDSAAFSKWRARTIARTEVAAAHIQAQLELWRASGVITHKVWNLGDLHDPRWRCECPANAADGAIPLGVAFASGDQGPPAHPNCVCTLTGEVQILDLKEPK